MTSKRGDVLAIERAGPDWDEIQDAAWEDWRRYCEMSERDANEDEFTRQTAETIRGVLGPDEEKDGAL